MVGEENEGGGVCAKLKERQYSVSKSKSGGEIKSVCASVLTIV